MMTVTLGWPSRALSPNARSHVGGAWTPDEIDFVRENAVLLSHSEIAAILGRTVNAVRGRAWSIGATNPARWTAEEEDILRATYNDAGKDGLLNLDALALRLGRHKTNVCRKAASLGLETNQSRKKVAEPKSRQRKYATDAELGAAISHRIKEHIRQNGHPKGMAGKRHSDATRARISVTSKERWESMSEDERLKHTEKGVISRLASGTLSPVSHKRGSWAAGWREIGGKRNYYRSRWEANYACYLEWLKVHGQIVDWAHEPETFWFEQIKRGVRSYKPDFRVWENDGTSALHEVKGWMDARSKTCLARMKKYFPSEKVILIDGDQYRAIRLKALRMVPGWEDSARDRRS
jgi:hypothetical protein